MAGKQTRFDLQLAGFAAKAGLNMDQVLRKVGLDMFTRVVRRSPVDTGAFRGAWTMTSGGALVLRGQIELGQGLPSLPIGTVGVEKIKAGEEVVILNGLPYGPRLENGYSKQAPAGMVAVTVQEFGGLVTQAAQQVNRGD